MVDVWPLYTHSFNGNEFTLNLFNLYLKSVKFLFLFSIFRNLETHFDYFLCVSWIHLQTSIFGKRSDSVKHFLAHQIEISVVFTNVRYFYLTHPYQP